MERTVKCFLVCLNPIFSADLPALTQCFHSALKIYKSFTRRGWFFRPLPAQPAPAPLFIHPSFLRGSFSARARSSSQEPSSLPASWKNTFHKEREPRAGKERSSDGGGGVSEEKCRGLFIDLKWIAMCVSWLSQSIKGAVQGPQRTDFPVRQVADERAKHSWW